MRLPPGEFLRLPLRVHTFLDDVPLRDVSAIDLPGGGEGRSVGDVRAFIPFGSASAGSATRLLFRIRWAVGRVFDWDDDRHANSDSFVSRLTANDLRASRLKAGTSDGEFCSLYEFDRESLAEVRNRTVHAFLCTALVRTSSGYRLYFAVYVRPVSWLTAPYMAAIEPFRRFVVYPAMMRRVRRAWEEEYGTGPGTRSTQAPR